MSSTATAGKGIPMAKSHTIKGKNGGLVTVEKYYRTKAIKAFCSECFQWEGNPKKDCTAPTCPLYPYRGKLLAANSG